jgi:hypothetical protein
MWCPAIVGEPLAELPHRYSSVAARRSRSLLAFPDVLKGGTGPGCALAGGRLYATARLHYATLLVAADEVIE